MKKIYVGVIVVSVLLLLVMGCAKQAAEQTITVPVTSAEEQEIAASSDELSDLDTLSQEADNDVNFEELEELTK